MPATTLTITVESDDEFHDRVLSDLEAFEEGADLDDANVLSLPDERALARVLSETNVELVRAIAQQAPESIREVARLVDRDVKEVHRNLSELEAYGLIDFEDDGRSKRPLVWYDEIEISVPVGSSATGEEPAPV